MGRKLWLAFIKWWKNVLRAHKHHSQYFVHASNERKERTIPHRNREYGMYLICVFMLCVRRAPFLYECLYL